MAGGGPSRSFEAAVISRGVPSIVDKLNQLTSRFQRPHPGREGEKEEGRAGQWEVAHDAHNAPRCTLAKRSKGSRGVRGQDQARAGPGTPRLARPFQIPRVVQPSWLAALHASCTTLAAGGQCRASVPLRGPRNEMGIAFVALVFPPFRGPIARPRANEPRGRAQWKLDRSAGCGDRTWLGGEGRACFPREALRQFLPLDRPR